MYVPRGQGTGAMGDAVEQKLPAGHGVATTLNIKKKRNQAKKVSG